MQAQEYTMTISSWIRCTLPSESMALDMCFAVWLSGERKGGKAAQNDLRGVVGGAGNKIDLRQRGWFKMSCSTF